MEQTENGPAIHLNLNVRGMRPSATVAINERSDALRREGRRVFKLGLGQSPFPVPEPVVQELANHAHEKDYLPVTGLRELREAVAEFHRGRDGLAATGDDVLIGPGSKELMFLLQLVFYGDLVIPTPSWVSYAPQAAILGRRVQWLSTRRDHNWMLLPDEFERVCQEDPGRPRILILNYPSNPTGDTYSTEQLERIAKVARAHRVVLLSDEIYGELEFDGRHTSIARFYPEGTIVSSGLSKWCGAGGWRLGTFVFPRSLRWLLDAMAAVASETYTSTSAPIQYAAVRAFAGGIEIEHFLHDSRRILQALGTRITTSLTDAGVFVKQPKGGFYLFPDFSSHRDALAARGITDSKTLCEHLLADTGVAILPGVVFGRPAHELTARLAFVDFDGARALSGLQGTRPDEVPDEAFLRLHCPNVCDAIDRLGKWLTS